MAARRDFCKVAPAIWASKRFAHVENEAKLLMLYLLTCPHQTSAGAFHLPAGYACTDLGWNTEAYNEALSKLVTSGLILFDPEEEEVFVKDWFRFNGITNPKHDLGTRKLIAALKSQLVRDAALNDLESSKPAQCLSKPMILAEKIRALR